MTKTMSMNTLINPSLTTQTWKKNADVAVGEGATVEHAEYRFSTVDPQARSVEDGDQGTIPDPGRAVGTNTHEGCDLLG